MPRLLVLVILLLSPVAMLAQLDTAIERSPRADPKTVYYKPPRLTPSTVTLYAALLPTFGQFYNRSYWKLPIFLGLGAWCGYNFIRLNNLYGDFKRDYQADLLQSPVPPTAEFNRRRRDFYRGQRDEFGVYIVLVYALSVVDAYIDAHLFEFDTSDVLTVLPPSDNQGGALTLLRLNLSF